MNQGINCAPLLEMEGGNNNEIETKNEPQLSSKRRRIGNSSPKTSCVISERSSTENGTRYLFSIDSKRCIVTEDEFLAKEQRVIGRLTNLQELNLSSTSMNNVHLKILLECKQLQVLNLSYTSDLLALPDGIANLSQLRELYLCSSAVSSLPHPSILAKLKNLEVLDLNGTYNLNAMRTDDLPLSTANEKLVSLRKLSLRYSGLLKRPLFSSPSSPSPWDSLFMPFFLSSRVLVKLALGGAGCIESLEDVVLQTEELELLDLSHTNISAIPHVSTGIYKTLARVETLVLTSTPLLRKFPLQAIPLTNHLPRLGCVGLKDYQNTASHRKLRCLLAQNRARLRIASLRNGSEGTNSKAGHHEIDKCHGLFPVALLPNLLTSRAAFKPYEQCKGCGDCQRLIKKKDALFFLLVNFSNEIFARPRVD